MKTENQRVLNKLFPGFIWQVPVNDKSVYLTFDDGPHPYLTDWVLIQLKKYNAKATFFCIGKNAANYPDVVERIKLAGHALGNHTHDHLDSWETNKDEYIANIKKCSEYVPSNLFRPPFGKLRRELVASPDLSSYKIILWNVMSFDFDSSISPAECASKVLTKVKPGSIIVFHDSSKAQKNLQFALIQVLEELSKLDFQFKALV